MEKVGDDGGRGVGGRGYSKNHTHIITVIYVQYIIILVRCGTTQKEVATRNVGDHQSAYFHHYYLITPWV